MTDSLIALMGAVAGGVVSAIVAYPLGAWQARKQTVREERIKVLIELRRLVRDLEDDFYSLAVVRPNDQALSDAVWHKIVYLRDYYRDKMIWFDVKADSKVVALPAAYLQKIRELRGQEAEAVEEVRRWVFEDLPFLEEAFEEEIRTVLGTKPPWWQRLHRDNSDEP
jgi:hypothetical protein